MQLVQGEPLWLACLRYHCRLPLGQAGLEGLSLGQRYAGWPMVESPAPSGTQSPTFNKSLWTSSLLPPLCLPPQPSEAIAGGSGWGCICCVLPDFFLQIHGHVDVTAITAQGCSQKPCEMHTAPCRKNRVEVFAGPYPSASPQQRSA